MEEPVHFDHWRTSVYSPSVLEFAALTLMRQPFSQLDILRLCGEGEEVALDRAFGIFLVEKAFRFCIIEAAIGAECGGDGR